MNPRDPSHYRRHIRLRNVESLGDINLSLSACRQPTDFDHISLSQAAERVPLSNGMRPMNKFVGKIFDLSSPSEVSWIHASFVTLAAVMGAMVLRSWRRSAYSLANDARNRCRASFNGDFRVPTAVSVVGPRNAFIRFHGEDGLNRSGGRSTRRQGRAASERVAVAKPTLVVGVTPSTFDRGLVAIWNRAYTLSFSHFDLRERLAWLERTVDLAGSGALAFCTTKLAGCKE